MPWAIYWVTSLGMRTLDVYHYSSSMTKNKGGPFVLGPLMPRCHFRGPIEMRILGLISSTRSPPCDTCLWHSAKMGHASCVFYTVLAQCQVWAMPLVSTIQHLHSAKNGPCPLYQQLCNFSSGSRPLRSSCWLVGGKWEEGASLSAPIKGMRGTATSLRVMDLD
jgi:hypothetical protein